MRNAYNKHKREFQRLRKLCEMGSTLIILSPGLVREERGTVKEHYKNGSDDDIRWLRNWLRQKAEG